ncbi:hypothetical protein LX32DRAFT_634195 [Colletotrichum zoysiae]|uniref:Uncharacterized protein n=1 Tax=Colletotrichum zoysiae TaxID=1216348 RepID=A0AAD9M628_9PEZI|nr:hypothetical protein LX32DRAFT_634195 [Colletotrichum zoysiae]
MDSIHGAIPAIGRGLLQTHDALIVCTSRGGRKSSPSPPFLPPAAAIPTCIGSVACLPACAVTVSVVKRKESHAASRRWARLGHAGGSAFPPASPRGTSESPSGDRG